MKRSGRLVLGAALGGLVSLAAGAAAQVSAIAGVRTQIPFAIGPLEVVTSGSMDRFSSPVGVRTPFTFDAALALPIRSGGVWLGSGLEGSAEVNTGPTRSLIRGGIWQNVHRVRVGIDASSHVARIDDRGRMLQVNGLPAKIVPDSVRTTGVDWTDVEGHVAWRSGRATFDGVIGARPRVGAMPQAVWSRLGVGYALSNRLSLVAAAGNEPSRLGIAVPGTRFGSVALRVNPWGTPKSTAVGERAAAFALSPAGTGTYRVTYKAANASSVEFSGDFDKWRPVSLVETRAGVWEATIAIAPGTYHVNVRVNGEKWVAPAGLPQAEDDFNGTVGVLVVR